MFDKLRYFQAIVQTNSFTKAAELCHISQSAISQQIRSLENELGITLIVREKRKVQITPAGKYLYQKSLPLIGELEHILEQTKGIAGKPSEQIRIGFLKGMENDEIQQALRAFKKNYPETRLSFREGNHEELYEWLRNEAVDLVLSDQRRAFSTLYMNDFLLEAPFQAEICSDHPLAGPERLNLEDLEDLPGFLVASPGQDETEISYYRDIIGYKGSLTCAQSLQEARNLALSENGFVFVEYQKTDPCAFLKLLPVCRNGLILFRRYYAFWKKSNSDAMTEYFAFLLKKSFGKDPDLI